MAIRAQSAYFLLCAVRDERRELAGSGCSAGSWRDEDRFCGQGETGQTAYVTCILSELGISDRVVGIQRSSIQGAWHQLGRVAWLELGGLYQL